MGEHYHEATQKHADVVNCLLCAAAKNGVRHFRTRDMHRLWPFYLLLLAMHGVTELEFDLVDGRYPHLDSALSAARLSGYIHERSPSLSDDDRQYFTEGAVSRITYWLEHPRRSELPVVENLKAVKYCAAIAWRLLRHPHLHFRDCVAETGYMRRVSTSPA